MSIANVIAALQSQAIADGISIEEKSIAMNYERELEGWVTEDIQDWLMEGGGEDYRKAKQLYEIAKALRKGGYFGMPVI